MEIIISNIKINYTENGQENNQAVILVHGWGQNANYFNNLVKDLSLDYHIFAIDLPGFGKSDKLPKIFTTGDYSNILLEFIKNLKIKKPILLGHSFGGKVIIDLVSRKKYNPYKIVLMNSSGIINNKLKRKYKIYKYKFEKKLILTFSSYQNAKIKLEKLQRKYASSDYKNSSGILRDSLSKIVDENYRTYLKQINSPTLILWGDKDLETPLKNAHLMHKYIKNSKLMIIEGANHFPLITNYNETLEGLITFFNE